MCKTLLHDNLGHLSDTGHELVHVFGILWQFALVLALVFITVVRFRFVLEASSSYEEVIKVHNMNEFKTKLVR